MSTQTKKAASGTLNRVRDLGTATKILITGNGTSTVVARIQKDLDSFLADLETFDEALWKVIHENKERLYRFLDAVGDRSKRKGEGAMNDLRSSWNKLVASGRTLGHDARVGARTIGRKANAARREVEDEVTR